MVKRKSSSKTTSGKVKTTGKAKPKKARVESLLDDVEDLLESDGTGVLEPLQDDEVRETVPVQDTTIPDEAPASSDSERTNPLDASIEQVYSEAGDGGNESVSASGDSEPAPQRISFDELVALYQEEPAKFTVLACEYTARMMIAQERIANALERMLVNVFGIDQTVQVLADVEVRKLAQGMQ